jgi:hypothetical protein
MGSTRSIHRSESGEHPFLTEAKKLAKQAGTDDNRIINWAVRLQEEQLVFVNTRRK